MPKDGASCFNRINFERIEYDNSVGPLKSLILWGHDLETTRGKLVTTSSNRNLRFRVGEVHSGLGSVEEDEERALTLTSVQHLSETQTYSQGIELICQKQKEFVKSSVESKWNLAEAQHKFGSLALHNSESTDQEYAKAQTETSELRQREEEWRRKEAALIQRERQNLLNTESFSKEVFNKDYISKSFIQKHEQKIRYFGMLGRWNDSQRFLSDEPYLICEETAKYLILWCFHLEAEQKRTLMEQIAHQATVMQFVIEMARSCNVDPRGCFHVFKKAEAGEEDYSEAFKTGLEAFKSRVRICSVSDFQAMSVQNPSVYTGIAEGLESLLQVKANCILHSTTRRIKKNTLSISVVAYHLAALDSSSYWSSNTSSIAAICGGVTSFKPS
ncbi:LOW QUALITY PROTEIN: hsp90 co-chaperone Cdc37-like 1 [Podargus strigoides]